MKRLPLITAGRVTDSTGRRAHSGTEVPYEFKRISGTLNAMEERELLEQALQIVRTLRQTLEQAYNKHDQDSDLVGGALLSSAKMFTKACEEAIIGILLHVNQKQSHESKK